MRGALVAKGGSNSRPPPANTSLIHLAIKPERIQDRPLADFSSFSRWIAFFFNSKNSYILFSMAWIVLSSLLCPFRYETKTLTQIRSMPNVNFVETLTI